MTNALVETRTRAPSLPRPVALAATGAALLLLLFVPLASAHAVLQSAEPAPNDHVDVGLEYVTIRFTEDVERTYTDADVVDLDGGSWRNGVIQFDDAERNVIRVPLRPLDNGIYTVAWRTLSVDTHTARGSFVFAVGSANLRFPVEPVSHDPTEHSPGRVLPEGAARAGLYLGLFVATGIGLFLVTVDRDRDPSRRALHAASALGAAGAVSGGVSFLLFANRTTLPLGEAAASTAGESLILRAALVGATALLLFLATVAPGRARRNLVALAILAGGAAMTVTALGSHAAALKEDRLLAIAADAAHLLVAAVWVGGVFGFVLLARGRDAPELATMIKRFSPLAMGSVALLLVTGIYSSLRHIPTLGDLLGTSYGRLVLAKLGLVLVLAAMGAYNQRVLEPSLRAGGYRGRLFRRAVGIEAVLMVFVVAAAGVLAASPPPDSAPESATAGLPPAFELSGTTPTVHVSVAIRPAPVQVGIQRVTVTLHSLTGEHVPNGTTVALKFAPPGEPEPESILTPEKQGATEWTTEEDAFFTSTGPWRMWVIVQQPSEYKKLEFEVDVAAPGGST